MNWLDELNPGVDWINSRAVAYQMDGADLVQVTNIDRETSEATVRVFASVDGNAPVIFEGKVWVKLAADEPGEDDMQAEQRVRY
ncbi:MAG: hypothetical protein M3N52_12030 [Actinomycetota bacterium]|nr:hypothetical protein [Actinomycetota bacterium]